MKILFLYETVYPDFIGGVEVRNYHLAAALARRGNQVTLAGFCGELTTDLPNLRILSFGPRPNLYNAEGKRSTRQSLRFAATVAHPARLDLGDFDVVETASVPYIHLLPLAARCASAGKPLLVTWYEYWGPYWKGYVGSRRAPVYRAIEWLTAQLGDAVTATSELTRSRLAEARAAVALSRTDEVDLVPCGLEVGEVTAAAGLAVHGSGPPLLYAGRLLTHKRLDLLLHAVALLAREGGSEGPLLTIFGEGPDRPRLTRLAEELGIAPRVLFRGHVEEDAEVWKELGRARLAVQPSAREGFGLFPLEAMAVGLPVVYCQSPESAVGELVRDGIEGVAAPPEPEELAAVLHHLLADEAEWRRFSQNARARAAGYDWSSIAERIEEICLSLLAAR